MKKVIFSIVTVAICGLLFVSSCRKETKTKSETNSNVFGEPLAPTSCTASSSPGAKCSINCNDPKTANCSGGTFRANCECIPLDPPNVNSTISLDPNHKVDETIALAYSFGTLEGEEFADALSDNYHQVSIGSFSGYSNTVLIVEAKFNNLATTEQNAILSLLD